MEIAGKSFIEMNIKDADSSRNQRWGQIKSCIKTWGNTKPLLVLEHKVSPGETWMPFHFPDGNANWLTNAALDKFARSTRIFKSMCYKN